MTPTEADGELRRLNPIPLKREAGPAIHLPFYRLEPIDLTFGLTVASLCFDGSGNGGYIFLQVGGKTGNRFEAGFRRPVGPTAVAIWNRGSLLNILSGRGQQEGQD